MLKVAALAVVCCAGCTRANDQAVGDDAEDPAVSDMRLGSALDDDLSVAPDLASGGVGDAGGDLLADMGDLLHCAALDKAESMCKATDQACVNQLRAMATPTAVSLDDMLQSCFHANCPLDGVCMPDGNGDHTMPCLQCVNNTLQADATHCTPPSGMGCQKCYSEGLACINDL